MHGSRENLAALQGHLLESLVTVRPPPDGFDVSRLKAASRALQRKRARSVKKVWPSLAYGLGSAFGARFAEYALECPTVPHSGAIVDGYRFARYLRYHELLPEVAWLPLAAFELRHRQRGGRLVHRRFAVRVMTLRAPKRLLLGLRLPGLGQRLAVVPIGRARNR